jgi:hypothetical protein
VFVSRDRPGPRVFRVAAGTSWLDLASIEGASIREDLQRRDFTVNALALPVSRGPLVDPFGGAADLARRALRGIRERNFHDDPLRPLRAARLLATRELEPDSRLLRWAKGAAAGLERVAPERASAELAKLLAAPRAAPALAWAASAWILAPALGVPLSRSGAGAVARFSKRLDGTAIRALPPDRRRRIRLAAIASRLGMDGLATRRWLSGRRWTRQEAHDAAAMVDLAHRAAAAPRADAAWRWVLDAGALAGDAGAAGGAAGSALALRDSAARAPRAGAPAVPSGSGARTSWLGPAFPPGRASVSCSPPSRSRRRRAASAAAETRRPGCAPPRETPAARTKNDGTLADRTGVRRP